jgi:hypothetical protein
MKLRTYSLNAARCGLAAAALLAVPACAARAGGNEATLTFHAPALSSKPVTVDKAKLLHPKRKYYGVFTPSAPARMDSIDTIANETGKQPNLDLYFQAWNSGAASGKPDFNPTYAENACGAGLLPLYTWESWDTAKRGHNPGAAADDNSSVLWAQPAFSPRKITAGKYDVFIRRTARLMRSINCPIALRFDQEVNGYWYPWSTNTQGMAGKSSEVRAKRYVDMWRHVWTIFEHQHATNVIWVWSPNFQGLKHRGYPALSAEYPGPKYVDWVGIDGYYYNNDSQNFKGLFGPTIEQLKTVAPAKPWLIAETGVGAGPAKPRQISNLLRAVAHRNKFNGFVYFDQAKPYDRSDWRFDADQSSLNAFKRGVSDPTYANGAGHRY